MKNDLIILKMKELAQNNHGSINHTIYSRIILDLNAVKNMSLDEFSKYCYTSKPSIMNFCKLLGLEGYQELKYQIKNYLESNSIKSPELTVSNSCQNNNKFIDDYFNLIKNNADVNKQKIYEDYSKYQDLANKLKLTQNIYIFCVNLAYFAAKNFVQRLRWINKNVILENDFNIIDSYINQMTEDSLVIIISLSGRNTRIIQVCKNIKNNISSFGFLGDEGVVSNIMTDYSLIPQDETRLWNNYSLRSQYLANIFDVLYMMLIK